jgi:hypothetical protein
MSNFNAHSASEQWRTRPTDQCFGSVDAALAAATFTMQHSAGQTVPSKSLQVDVESSPAERKRLVVVRPSGKPVVPNHWAFGQLCARIGVPAGYMRDIAANDLVADCMNEAIARRDVDDISVLLYQNGGPAELHAVNGPNYGRIWNARVWEAIRESFGDGLTGKFKIPSLFVRGGIRQEAVQTELANIKDTTLYSSDRDMWCMLACDDDVVEVPNRRDGKTGHIYQGVVIGNSDVGAGTLWMARFGFDDFCYNHMIWGMRNLEEVSLRHTASAPHRFLSEIIPTLKTIAQERGSLKQAQVLAAQAARISDFDKFMASRKFSRSQIGGMKAAYKSDEGAELPQEDGITSASIWQAVVAATAYARSLQYTDARVAIQREAGKMLQAA